jgi:hypothetical protein
MRLLILPESRANISLHNHYYCDSQWAFLKEMKYVVSYFRRGASDVFPLVGYYAALICIQLSTLRHTLSVPSSVMTQSYENSFWTALTL